MLELKRDLDIVASIFKDLVSRFLAGFKPMELMWVYIKAQFIGFECNFTDYHSTSSC